MSEQNWTPGALLEVSSSFWKTCTLHAAVKMNVFTVIGDEERLAADIARDVHGETNSVVRLLDALVAMELLEKNKQDDEHELYSNTDFSKEFLAKDSPKYLGHIIMHHHHLVESWFQLDKSVLSGKPYRSSHNDDEEWRESYLMGMFNLASGLAPHVVPALDLSGRKHLLDLGGGPGTYAIHCCLRNEQLNATVYDLPTTRSFAEQTIDKFHLSDRIQFMEGNYLEDEAIRKDGYDVAWLSHVLHGEGPDDCRKILKKTVRALEPGGMIIIHEFILNNSMDGPLFPALFSLNMLLETESGQAYSEQQLTDMMTAVGVGNIQRIPVQTPNDSGILVGFV